MIDKIKKLFNKETKKEELSYYEQAIKSAQDKRDREYKGKMEAVKKCYSSN